MSRKNKNALRCGIARRSLIAAYLFSWAFFRKIFLLGKRCIQVVTNPHKRAIRQNNDRRKLSAHVTSSLFKGIHLHTMFLNFGIGELFTQKFARQFALFPEFTSNSPCYFSCWNNSSISPHKPSLGQAGECVSRRGLIWQLLGLESLHGRGRQRLWRKQDTFSLILYCDLRKDSLFNQTSSAAFPIHIKWVSAGTS